MGQKEVLILEDDRRFRNVITNAFKGEHYTGPQYKFHEARTIDDGIRVLNEHRSIQVILLDLMLPDGSGRDFLDRIRDRIKRYRVIVLTAHDEKLAAEMARDYGVFNYLPKAARSFTQSIRFSVEQAFNNIEREQMIDRNKLLVAIQNKINSCIQESTESQQTLEALRDVLNLTCRSVRDLLGAYTCHIRLYSLKRGEFDLIAFDGPNNKIRQVFDIPRRKGELFSGRVAKSKTSLLFDNLQEDEEFGVFREQSLKRIERLNNAQLLAAAGDYFGTIKSAFIAPITTRIFDDETDAIFNVSSDSGDFFSEENQEIIKELVIQATIALTKAWQKQRKEESHHDYKAISKVLEDISKELRGEDVKKQIYHIATKGIADIIKPETVSIFLYNRTTRLLDNVAEFRGYDQVEPRKEGHPTNVGLTGFVFSEGKSLRIPNLQKGDRTKPQKHERYSKDLETDYIGKISSGRVNHYLGVPMIIGDEVVGAIQLLNKKSEYYLNEKLDQERWLLERGFSDDCESILWIAAGYLAVAIKNAELLEERDRRIRQLDTLKDAGRYTSAETLNQLLNKIIAGAAKDVQAEICLLYLFDDKRERVLLEECYGIPKQIVEGASYEIGQGLTGRVAETGIAELQEADYPVGRYDEKIKAHLQNKYGKHATIESEMAVPIRTEGGILGVIKAINKKGVEGQYNAEDLIFFETYASYVGIAIDNAQRYEMASRNLANAESNSTLSNLVASVAHEINNTYGLIPDDVEELRQALPNPNDNVNNLLDEIKDLTMQMVYYSNEIGGFSIGGMGQKEVLNINDEVTKATDQIPEFRKPGNFKSIDLRVNLWPSPLRCLLNCNPLIRTIRNIIINAYQALDNRGNGEIVIRTYEDVISKRAKIEISDNGCGIKEEHKDKVFDPKFTTKTGKGSGIGLWLAKRYLDSIGGTITFDSVENRGTTFTLGLPLHRSGPTQ